MLDTNNDQQESSHSMESKTPCPSDNPAEAASSPAPTPQRKCPICAYPICAPICPECGSALSEAHDEQLLRHREPATLRRLLLAARLLVAGPLIFLFWFLTLFLIPFFVVVAGPERSDLTATIVIVAGLALVLLSVASWLAGGWIAATQLAPELPTASKVAKITIPLLAGAITLYIIAALASAPAALTSTFAAMKALLLAVVAWQLVNMGNWLWNRTSHARYRMRYGVHRRVRRRDTVPTLIKAGIALWTIAWVTNILLPSRDGEPETLADTLSLLATVIAFLLGLLAIGFGTAALYALARAINSEMRQQAKPPAAPPDTGPAHA